MDYREALRFLYSFTDYERVPPQDRRPFRLGPFRMLLRKIGDPHTRYTCVHIAGTKGKGSVASMIERVLREADLITGLYTSPHLEHVRERIQVSGNPIPRGSFAAGIGTLREVMDSERAGGYRTTFELLTALAFHHFARRTVDVAVIETGLGGLLDSTNVIRPAVAVITPVSVEHASVLGHTLAEVAYQKAGIIKRGSHVVSARQKPPVQSVIERRCRLVGVPLTQVGRDVTARQRAADRTGQWVDITTPSSRYRRLRLALLGRHQVANAGLAVAALEALGNATRPLGETSVRLGFENVRWPGRLEVVGGNPPVLLDGAHTPGSLSLLSRYLRESSWVPDWRRRAIIFGISRDKPSGTMLAQAKRLGRWLILTRSNHPKAAVPCDLARRLPTSDDVATAVCEPLEAALDVARGLAGRDGLVVVTGSLYLVGDLRRPAAGGSPR